MSSAYYNGTYHYFTNRNGSQDPTIYIKPGINETLNITGTTEGISKELSDTFVDLSNSTVTNYTDPTSDNTQPAELGSKSIRGFGTTVFTTVPGYENTLGDEEGGSVYYELSGSTWTYQGHLLPQISCAGTSPDGVEIDYYKVGTNEIFVQNRRLGGYGIMENSGSGWVDVTKAGDFLGDVTSISCYIDYAFLVIGTTSTLSIFPKGVTTPGVWNVSDIITSDSVEGNLGFVTNNSTRVYALSSTATESFVNVFDFSGTLITRYELLQADTSFGKYISCNDDYVVISTDKEVYVFDATTNKFVTSFKAKTDETIEGVAIQRDSLLNSTIVFLGVDSLGNGKVYFVYDLILQDQSTYSVSVEVPTSTNYSLAIVSSYVFVGNWNNDSNSGLLQSFTFDTQTLNFNTDTLDITADSLTISHRTGTTVESTLKDYKLAIPQPDNPVGGSLNTYSMAANQIVGNTIYSSTLKGSTVEATTLKTNLIEDATKVDIDIASTNKFSVNATSTDVENVLNVNDTTDSTSTTTGSVIVDGGVGVAKKLFANSISAVNVPHYNIVSTVTQSIPNATGTRVNGYFNSLVSSFGITNTAGVFTVPEDGIYNITYSIYWDTTVAGTYRLVWIRKNTSFLQGYGHSRSANISDLVLTGSVNLKMDAGDNVDIIVQHNAGSPIDLVNSVPLQGGFSICKIL